LAAIIYTDISKDGMLCGPNIGRTQALAQAVDIPVVASGGVSNLADIKNLAAVKVIDAVIAGRSLYEGTLDLAEAIETAQRYS
jgi:phosphoribosylformimino-5-aminoimidazole carboxamide ribotide isomerase